MSRRRYARLDELDGDHFDDQGPMQSNTRDVGAGSARRIFGGPKNDYPLFGGIGDQCGTCHQRKDRCHWQQEMDRLREQGRLKDQWYPHPR